MHLTHLSLTNFRAFSRLDIELPGRILLLVGNNAQGKTSLLEAVYYLATLNSFHAQNDRQLINFIAGQETQAVTRLVAASKSKDSPPPVTLYGPSGTGKSHLARHAARAFRSHFPGERVTLVTAAQFGDEFAEASEAKSLAAFVRKYRGATGLLICEDLQALVEVVFAVGRRDHDADARLAPRNGGEA